MGISISCCWSNIYIWFGTEFCKIVKIMSMKYSDNKTLRQKAQQQMGREMVPKIGLWSSLIFFEVYCMHVNTMLGMI